MRIRNRLREAGYSALFAAALLLPGQALADPGTQAWAREIGGNDQVANAANAASDALVAVGTSGRGSRGASGAIASLLTSSDTWICAAWLVTFQKKYEGLVVEYEADFYLSPQEADALEKMRALKTAVERECDKILVSYPDDGGAGVVDGGGSGTAGNGGDFEEPEETGFVPHEKDETIVDRICWDRCSHLWLQAETARRAYNQAAERANQAQDRAEEARSEHRETLREKLAERSRLRERLKASQDWLQEVRQWARAEMARARRVNAGGPDAVRGVVEEQLNEAQARLERSEQELERFEEVARRQLRELDATADELEQAARDRSSEANTLKGPVQTARAAYIACTQQCYTQAGLGGYQGPVKVKNSFGGYEELPPPANGGGVQQSSSQPSGTNGQQRPNKQASLLDSIRNVRGGLVASARPTGMVVPTRQTEETLVQTGGGFEFPQDTGMQNGNGAGMQYPVETTQNVVTSTGTMGGNGGTRTTGYPAGTGTTGGTRYTGGAGGGMVVLGSGPTTTTTVTSGVLVLDQQPVLNGTVNTAGRVLVTDPVQLGTTGRQNVVLNTGRANVNTGVRAGGEAVLLEQGQPAGVVNRVQPVQLGTRAGNQAGAATNTTGRALVVEGLAR